MALSISANRTAEGWQSNTTGRTPGVSSTFHTVINVEFPNGGVVVSEGMDTAEAEIAEEMLPGEGWDGATDTPPLQGDGSSVDGISGELLPMARWDFVQNDIIESTTNIGVVCFSTLGVAKVDIAVEGGNWVADEVPSLNADSGIVEYHAALNPANCTDGLVELRSRQWATHGECGTLQDTGGLSAETSLRVYCNAGGSLSRPVRYVSPSGSDSNPGTLESPMQTIAGAGLSICDSRTSGTYDGMADGGIIYCLAGTYYFPATQVYVETLHTYLTIMPAPGTAKADVLIQGGYSSEGVPLPGDNGGIYCKYLKVQGCTIKSTIRGNAALDDTMWYHDCEFDGEGRFVDNMQIVQFNKIYMTDCFVHDVLVPPDGVFLWRNCVVERIAGGCYHASPLVLNSTLEDSDREGDPEIHPDILQAVDFANNWIWYGVESIIDDEPMDTVPIRINNGGANIAVINCTLPAEAPEGWGFGALTEHTNFYALNLTMTSPVVFYPTTICTDVVFENCDPIPSAYPGVIVL